MSAVLRGESVNKDTNLPSGRNDDEPLPAANEPLATDAQDIKSREKTEGDKASSRDGLVPSDR